MPSRARSWMTVELGAARPPPAHAGDLARRRWRLVALASRGSATVPPPDHDAEAHVHSAEADDEQSVPQAGGTSAAITPSAKNASPITGTTRTEKTPPRAAVAVQAQPRRGKHRGRSARTARTSARRPRAPWRDREAKRGRPRRERVPGARVLTADRRRRPRPRPPPSPPRRRASAWLGPRPTARRRRAPRCRYPALAGNGRERGRFHRLADEAQVGRRAPVQRGRLGRRDRGRTLRRHGSWIARRTRTSQVLCDAKPGSLARRSSTARGPATTG